jgi:hypothetical protein
MTQASTPGSLFVSAAYLQPLEDSGCLRRNSGWMPAHLQRPGGGWSPCYQKSHSWGEFVFDFEFANAYARQGLDYYPKQVCCAPFTPVPGPRLIAGTDEERLELAAELVENARAGGCSSAHILFLPLEELELVEPAGWLRRLQLRYVWRNRGYAGFEDFLAQLSSKKRKNIRRERRSIRESGFEIDWRTGAELTAAELRTVFELYASTYQERGQSPYLNLACLRTWARNFGERMLFCLARLRGKLVAMAFFFRDDVSLYGRHWGADADYDGLHFELCYYQGIEWCIRHGLYHFDAGVQGEHRLLRGFEPEFSYSAHWFAHQGFAAAIAHFLDRERAALTEHIQLLRRHDAYRDATDPSRSIG